MSNFYPQPAPINHKVRLPAENIFKGVSCKASPGPQRLMSEISLPCTVKSKMAELHMLAMLYYRGLLTVPALQRSDLYLKKMECVEELPETFLRISPSMAFTQP